MKFTPYLWNLYKDSELGKKEISLFKSKNHYKLAEKFRFDITWEYEQGNKSQETFYPYNWVKDEVKGVEINDFSEARKLFSELIIEYFKDEEGYNDFFEYIEVFSTALHHAFPDYFLPFYFTRSNYPDFIKLCENFEIILTENPSRNNWIKKTWFYFDICVTLHEFRRKVGIESLEFPAFIYHFGLRSLEIIEEQDLPKPSKARFVGGGKWDYDYLDNINNNSVVTWGAGNLNIKKGDIVLMYCTSPRSSLHSIWRAIEDSFANPFTYYYYQVKIGYPKEIPTITLKELRDNQVLKNNPTVRGNMQGLNGRAISVKEYDEIFCLIEEKNKSIKSLPQLPKYHRDYGSIENEREVEIKLIEPLLKDLGFKEKDWVRQFPLRMGRQTKYYPDYAILVNTTKGQEKAKYILETKYSINSDKQLDDAFYQARSYALRLRSNSLILADRDFVWLYEIANGNFQQKPIFKFHWNDLNNSDNLHRLKERLSK